MRNASIRGMLALAMAGWGAAAGAATVIDTGPGTIAPSSAVIAAQNFTFSRFTLSRSTAISDIAFYGTVATAGTASFSLWFDDGAGVGPGTNRAVFSGRIAASPIDLTGAIAGWHGVSGLADTVLQAGSWWVGAGSDGLFNAVQYGGASRALDRDVVQGLTGMRTDASHLDLAWRISGAPVPRVPEPAAWAMMTIGFSLTGLALRWRPRPAAG